MCVWGGPTQTGSSGRHQPLRPGPLVRNVASAGRRVSHGFPLVISSLT